MWVTLLFVYAVLATSIGVFLGFVAMLFKLTRLMRFVEFIVLSALATLALALIRAALDEPALWFLVAFLVAMLTFGVWALVKNAAERRAGQRILVVGPPPSRGRTWDREEQPPTG